MTSSGEERDASIDRFVAERAGQVARRSAAELDRLLLETSQRPLADVPAGAATVHRLIGTLGTFGLSTAADLLASAARVEPASADACRDLLAAARSALEGAPAAPDGAPAPGQPVLPSTPRPPRLPDPPPAVLVVEDDPDVAAWTVAALSDRLGAVTEVVPGAAAARRAAGPRLDVVVVDLELADGDGLGLTEELTRTFPGLPVVIVSSHASFDAAAAALRAGAVDFLAKPADPDRLAAAVGSAAAARRGQPATRVLAVGAHPDDVELAISATLAKHVAAGDEVTVLVCSRGEAGGTDRAHEARQAADLLGVSLVQGDLPDTAIDDGVRTVRLIEHACARVAPDVVYLHSSQDTHQDHRAVHRAGLVAARSVPLVACFQSPSATVAYRPTRFEDVTGFLPAKLAAIAAHRSQAGRTYLDPELVTATARYWGRFGGVRYAEPLELVRDVAPVRVVSSPARSHHLLPDPLDEPGAEP
ncbi:MAG: PIG-L family deacetylase [Motilibacteraceae bacterium]